MGSESVAVGYRFHPTDEELVNHYLKYKMMREESRVSNIPEVDICKWEPWELPALSGNKSEDPEWYFFSQRDNKYNKSGRSKRATRATRAGYWKPTGNDRNIKLRRNNRLIGMKKTLVFYKGRAPTAIRTSWVMHEYRATDEFLQFPVQKSFVLYRLKRKHDENNDFSTCEEVGPSGSQNVTTGMLGINNGHSTGNVASDSENYFSRGTTPEVDPQIEALLKYFNESTHQPLDHNPLSLEWQSLMQQGQGTFVHSCSPNSFTNPRSGPPFQIGDEDEDIDVTEFFNNDLNSQDGGFFEESRNLRNMAGGGSRTKSNVIATSAQPLSRVHVMNNDLSSDTDTGVPQQRFNSVLETGRSTSGWCLPFTGVSSFGTLASSNTNHYRSQNRGFLDDEFGASSDESAEGRAYEINCLEIPSPKYRANRSVLDESGIDIRTRESLYSPRFQSSVKQGIPSGKIHLQGAKLKGDLIRKHGDKPISVETGEAASNNLRGSFTVPEKPLPPVSHWSSSPSDYLVNLIVGIVFFVVFFCVVVADIADKISSFLT